MHGFDLVILLRAPQRVDSGPDLPYIYIPSLRAADTQMSPWRNISRYGTSVRKYR
jgi:hypothetical protein